VEKLKISYLPIVII